MVKKHDLSLTALRILVAALIISLLMMLVSHIWIIKSTRGRLYADIREIPPNFVGLVLGTSPYTSSGGENFHFTRRVAAASELYKRGKIKRIIVSGDNRKMNYNEPLYLMKALIKKGVPATAITMDFAGLRTLDSVIRAKEVFGQENLTVISQKYHNYRAVFIGEHYGIDIVGFNAGAVPSRHSLKTELREYLAQIKTIMDLYILKTKPKHLGPRVVIK